MLRSGGGYFGFFCGFFFLLFLFVVSSESLLFNGFQHPMPLSRIEGGTQKHHEMTPCTLVCKNHRPRAQLWWNQDKGVQGLTLENGSC